MNDELDKAMKRARVPEHTAGYWENFPKRVTTRLAAEPVPAAPIFANRHGIWTWAVASALAALIVCLGVWVRGRIVRAQPDYAKLYHEIESMFPNQVRAIVVDRNGMKLDLSDKPDVPPSSPVRVDVCRNEQCATYITFSGQSIRLNGETCDLLSDGQGHFSLVGRGIVWTSSDPSRHPEAYHIEAGPLGARS